LTLLALGWTSLKPLQCVKHFHCGSWSVFLFSSRRRSPSPYYSRYRSRSRSRSYSPREWI